MMWNSKAIVFDLDDTLYAESSYFIAVFSEFCSENKWPQNSFSFIKNNFSHIRKNQKDIFKYFLIQNIQYWQHKNESIQTRNFKFLHDKLFDLYMNIKVKLKPMQGVSDWFRFAFDNDLKIGVLTNGVIEAQYNKWGSLDVKGKDNVIFKAARECEREKPSLESFVLMARSLELDFSEVTFIGDRFDNDLAYPLSQGSSGILINQCVSEYGNEKNMIFSDNLNDALSVFKKYTLLNISGME